MYGFCIKTISVAFLKMQKHFIDKNVKTKEFLKIHLIIWKIHNNKKTNIKYNSSLDSFYLCLSTYLFYELHTDISVFIYFSYYFLFFKMFLYVKFEGYEKNFKVYSVTYYTKNYLLSQLEFTEK